jgi:hypothetical protein
MRKNLTIKLTEEKDTNSKKNSKKNKTKGELLQDETLLFIVSFMVGGPMHYPRFKPIIPKA